MDDLGDTVGDFSGYKIDDDSLAKREAELYELNRALDLESASLLKEDPVQSATSLSGRDKSTILEEEAALAEDESGTPSSRTGEGGSGRVSRIPRSTTRTSPGAGGKQQTRRDRPSSIPRKGRAGGVAATGSGARRRGSSSRQQPEKVAPTRDGQDTPPSPPAASEPGDPDEELSSLGPEGTIRFQRARIKVLESQLKDLHERCQELDAEANNVKAEMRSHLDEKKKLSKELQAASMAAKKQAKMHEKVETTTGDLQQQLSLAREQLRDANKSNKEAQDKNKKLELRLTRALEDVEKYKAAAQQAKNDVRDNSSQQLQSGRELEARCQRLERQKTELLNAFRKQMRLIDILKRQKVHIEAAKLLSFTEEEFMKILDWGS